MTLETALAGCDARIAGDARREIVGVTHDSRAVRPGYAFVAIPGFQTDGVRFVADALERGAAAIVSETAPDDAFDLSATPWARVPDARAALAPIAAALNRHPSESLLVVGVTGTNGKTTVTALLEHLLAARGLTGRWSTTLVRWGDHSFPTPRTTPEAGELQEALAAMRDAGCRHAIIEVSSHALCLHRVDAIRFRAAVFTNLSPDHLDFHETMEQYLAAKGMLFERLADDAPAVINGSDPRSPALMEHVRGRPVTYGWPERAHLPLDYSIVAAEPGPGGTSVRIETPAGELRLRTSMRGAAMVENVAAATAAASELGVPAEAIAERVAGFRGEPGRLEPVLAGQDFEILVDFAHTPAALEAAIDAARAGLPGRLLVVFGCGGDRDRGKRPLMGEIAARGADVAFVTSDNPRSESPEAILGDVLAGVPEDAPAELCVEPDRARAIGLAVGRAQPGDCVLIAGKGHETEQIFADRTIPFDDREVAARAVRERQQREAG